MAQVLTKKEIKQLIKDYERLEAPEKKGKRRALKKLKSKRKKK